MAHSLKNVASRFEVPVVFSAPRRLSRICARSSGAPSAECVKKHTKCFLKCSVGVVYKIPLSCGKVYIGQSGRCINDRVREHALSMRNGTGSHLPHHCKECSCEPLLNSTSILRRSKDKVARELAEAMYIKQFGNQCISVPSLSLFENEFAFLSERLS